MSPYFKENILPILISSVLTFIVTYVASIFTFDYQLKKQSKKTVVKIKEHKSENRTSLVPHSPKQIGFDLSLQESELTKISLKVVENKIYDPLYEMVLYGKGGGFGESFINIADVKLEENKDEYILFDKNRNINLFKKRKFNPYFNKNLPTEVFNIFLNTDIHYFYCKLLVDVEHSYFDGTESRDDILRVGPQVFTFNNPIEVKSIITSDIKKIYVAGFTKYKKDIRNYFSKFPIELSFIQTNNNKYIQFDNKFKLISYNDRMHFVFRKIKLR